MAEQIKSRTLKQIPHPAAQRYPRNQWYVAAFSDEVDRRLFKRTLLDTPVVFFRTEDGRPIALHDRCPHRHLPLSMGKLTGDEIQCGYHGLQIAENGRCVKAPQQDFIPPDACVNAFPLIEKWQWIWIWMGDAEKADPDLLPDHVKWLGMERPGYTAIPFFAMEMKANYQLMHDNLMDTSHLSFVHPNLLDTGDMAVSEFWTAEEDRLLKLGRTTRNLRFPPAIASYFKVEPDHPYDRTLVVETYLPSVNIGKQTILDPNNPDAGPHELYAVNALTPKSSDAMHVFHAQVTTYDMGFSPELRDSMRVVLDQDRSAVEAVQERYNQFGGADEISLQSDKMGILCRRRLDAMVEAELA